VENGSDQEISSLYLVVDDEVIYKIASNSVLNIGRLNTNDIVLDDYKVSREHAVLKFSRSEITLVDLASTHGSFVNGERIDRCPIHFGDVIRIVSHVMVLSRDLPEARMTETGSMKKPKMGRTLDRRLKFFGGLNEFPLITLVQFLHQEKQSGLLLLELGQTPSARIYFQDGEITDFPDRTITESTPTYLMRLCQSIDEKHLRDLRDTGDIWASKPQSETARVPLPPFRQG
jgi:pSer/pThr/pTyr-binding forkhead associated (FHA) protein